VPGEPREPIALELRVVVVVEVVQADHAVAARKQQLRHVHADETGRAGDENLQDRYPFLAPPKAHGESSSAAHLDARGTRLAPHRA
jgi:hypothetical protein